MSKKSSLYFYSALVKRVIDGDTIVVDIDLGFNLQLNDVRLRLAGINTPEIRGLERPQGLAAKEFLKNLIEGKTIHLHTVKADAWQRWIADIWFDKIHINSYLVELEFAVYKEY